MKKFYQTHWFEIDFKSFTALDSKKVADTIFYDMMSFIKNSLLLKNCLKIGSLIKNWFLILFCS